MSSLFIRLVVLAVALAACTGTSIPETGSDAGQRSESSVLETSTTTVPDATAETTSSTTTGAAPTVADRVRDATETLDSALYDPEEHRGDQGPQPVGLSINDIAVDSAPVIPVGVIENGEMEIPGRLEVGWYRFGPAPGERGSAVLAAHIAFDGADGVFRRLSRLEPGATVEVTFDDGSVEVFEVVEMAQYDKEELPFDRVFAREGDPGLTLITCGGDFNRSLNSYDDNVVAYAVPLD